ncbi:MAG: carboxypeptidase regulatory-like domain-containing protein [Saprospiraceae bacterium]|nr:carboxypeptidase regulatory-like domain-containing protein [Saprospiraceae bacterium]
MAAGYVPKTVTVTLTNGQVTVQDFQLTPAIPFTVNGQVVDEQGATIADAKVLLEGIVTDYTFTTDASGTFSATMDNGSYDVLAGKWGYNTRLIQDTLLDVLNPNIVIELTAGYKDEFVLDLGWITTANAQTGAWQRGKPNGTSDPTYGQVAPGEDVTTDLGEACYVTGNNGSSFADDDVDNGTVRLISPMFDATGYIEPYVKLETWFVNVGGNGTPNDALTLQISDGVSTTTVEIVTLSDPNWTARTYRLKDYLTPSATMRFYHRNV